MTPKPWPRVRVWLACLAGLVLAAVCLRASGPALAAPAAPAGGAVLRCPERVGEGRAFVARLESPAPVQAVTVRWLGKEFQPEVTAQGKGSAAEFLLGVGLRERLKEDAYALVVEFVGPRGKQTLRQTVRRVPAAYPEQRLAVEDKYVSPSAEALARYAREKKDVDAAIGLVTPRRLWRCPLLHPAPGDISSVFGLRRVLNNQPRSSHGGVDFRVGTGVAVKACAPGRAVLAAEHYFSGKSVYIDHGQGVVSMYFHLSALKAEVGREVAAGEVVGLVGATGVVTGPHLHFGVSVLGQLVDPMPLIQGQCRAQ